MAGGDWSAADIAHYTCYRTRRPLTIDGVPNEAAWAAAPRSPRFVDMVSGDPGFFDTRAAALWDDENLYVAYWVEEPFVEAAQTERDSIVFADNDVEVLIDGGDCYYEFEINALGTVYEVFFVWRDAYRPGSRFATPEFDLLTHQALSFGGDYDRKAESFWWGTHPRGLRWAFLDWDLPGLRTAVHVDGQLMRLPRPAGQRAVLSRGWSAELVFPWRGMAALAGGRSLPPRDGDTWRMFFGRFERLMASGLEVQPHPAWVWSHHGVYDTHLPDRWPFVHFSEQEVESKAEG